VQKQLVRESRGASLKQPMKEKKKSRLKTTQRGYVVKDSIGGQMFDRSLPTCLKSVDFIYILIPKLEMKADARLLKEAFVSCCEMSHSTQG
jgi:hypothetical protein